MKKDLFIKLVILILFITACFGGGGGGSNESSNETSSLSSENTSSTSSSSSSSYSSTPVVFLCDLSYYNGGSVPIAPTYIKHVVDGTDVYTLVIEDNWTYKIKRFTEDSTQGDTLVSLSVGSFYSWEKIFDFDVNNKKVFYIVKYPTTGSVDDFDCMNPSVSVSFDANIVACIYSYDPNNNIKDVIDKVYIGNGLVDTLFVRGSIAAASQDEIFVSLYGDINEVRKYVKHDTTWTLQTVKSLDTYHSGNIYVIKDNDNTKVVLSNGYLFDSDLTLLDSQDNYYNVVLVSNDSLYMAEFINYSYTGTLLEAKADSSSFNVSNVDDADCPVDFVSKILGLNFEVVYEGYIPYLYINDVKITFWTGDTLEDLKDFVLENNFLSWYIPPATLEGVYNIDVLY